MRLLVLISSRCKLEAKTKDDIPVESVQRMVNSTHSRQEEGGILL